MRHKRPAPSSNCQGGRYKDGFPKGKLVSRALEIGICNEEIRAGDTAPESQEMRMSFVSPGARVETEVRGESGKRNLNVAAESHESAITLGSRQASSRAESCTRTLIFNSSRLQSHYHSRSIFSQWSSKVSMDPAGMWSSPALDSHNLFSRCMCAVESSCASFQLVQHAKEKPQD